MTAKHTNPRAGLAGGALPTHLQTLLCQWAEQAAAGAAVLTGFLTPLQPILAELTPTERAALQHAFAKVAGGAIAALAVFDKGGA